MGKIQELEYNIYLEHLLHDSARSIKNVIAQVFSNNPEGLTIKEAVKKCHDNKILAYGGQEISGCIVQLSKNLFLTESGKRDCSVTGNHATIYKLNTKNPTKKDILKKHIRYARTQLINAERKLASLRLEYELSEKDGTINHQHMFKVRS